MIGRKMEGRTTNFEQVRAKTTHRKDRRPDRQDDFRASSGKNHPSEGSNRTWQDELRASSGKNHPLVGSNRDSTEPRSDFTFPAAKWPRNAGGLFRANRARLRRPEQRGAVQREDSRLRLPAKPALPFLSSRNCPGPHIPGWLSSSQTDTLLHMYPSSKDMSTTDVSGFAGSKCLRIRWKSLPRNISRVAHGTPARIDQVLDTTNFEQVRAKTTRRWSVLSPDVRLTPSGSSTAGTARPSARPGARHRPRPCGTWPGPGPAARCDSTGT